MQQSTTFLHYSASMTEEFKEVKTDTDDDEEMSGSPSTADTLVIPLRQQLSHIDQLYPPPNKPTQPESFHSVGQKRRRLYESAAGMKSPQQTAASLYRDALHSIYQFLDIEDFVLTCTINKTYYSAGQQMKPRRDELFYAGPIFLLVQSPLRIHIDRLEVEDNVDPDELLLLQYRMGHISHLKVNVKLSEDEFVKYSSPHYCCFTIPKQLQSLDLSLCFWNGCNLTTEKDVRTYISGCMKQIAVQSTRLTKLSVILLGCADSMMDCPNQELRNLSTLTDLSLSSRFNFDQQIDLIKALPSIRIWSPTEEFTPTLIQRLVDGPIGPPPKLEDIGSFAESEIVDELMAEQLKRIVTLTRLDISSMSLTDPTKLLPHFPRLSLLRLRCQESVNINQLVLALSTCVSLTDLTLSHTQLTSHHIGQFLPHLRSLVKLTFYRCVNLVSLEFLTTARASLGQIRTFAISASNHMPINEYHHLRSISRSLEHLTIVNSSIGHFDPLTIGRWTPDSKEFSREEWPKLRWFML